ncbi:LYR motif-containing protein [Sporobolomyces koalae]|uniref:LYR motif-containing protein n=1 Tax=Sporobolomyces koalae TaxID=500713 RepID=UPI003174ACD7
MNLIASPLHRIPTLWSLYRPLLRAARQCPISAQDRFVLLHHIRQEFKRSKRLANPNRIRIEWTRAEHLLDQLERSHHSTRHLSETLALTTHLSHIDAEPGTDGARPPRRRTAKTQGRTPIRVSVRPTIIHSTLYNPPMLRLRPQPLSTSMMFRNRRIDSQRRYDRLAIAREYLEYARDEQAFERDSNGRWGTEWTEWIKLARAREKREQARNNLTIPDKMQARARRINLNRESYRKRTHLSKPLEPASKS